jgi:hypothetical protein
MMVYLCISSTTRRPVAHVLALMRNQSRMSFLAPDVRMQKF